MFKDTEGNETERALRALATLPFVGLVEKFEQSVDTLTQYLTPHFPAFHALHVAKNVIRNTSIPIEQKLAEIKAEIGDACYAELLEANAADMALYHSTEKTDSKSRSFE